MGGTRMISLFATINHSVAGKVLEPPLAAPDDGGLSLASAGGCFAGSVKVLMGRA